MRLSRPPPLRNLRAFCAAARHRSFKASAAQLDLAKAEALSPKADFVARNLEALRARNALAQVAAGPQS